MMNCRAVDANKTKNPYVTVYNLFSRCLLCSLGLALAVIDVSGRPARYDPKAYPSLLVVGSPPACFKIVNFPAEAACTICRSILLLMLVESFYAMR
jgi:hypothetical protein